MATKLKGPGIGKPEPIDKAPGIGPASDVESPLAPNPQAIQSAAVEKYAALLIRLNEGETLSADENAQLAALAAAVNLRELECPHCRTKLRMGALDAQIEKDAAMIQGFIENDEAVKRAQADKNKADAELAEAQAQLDAAAAKGGDCTYLEKLRNAKLLSVSCAGASLAHNQCKVPTPGTKGNLLWQAFNRMRAASGA